MSTLKKDSSAEFPSEQDAGSLPAAENAGDVFAASGWGSVPPEEPAFDEVPGRRKPEFVQRDDEEAFRKGFRPVP